MRRIIQLLLNVLLISATLGVVRAMPATAAESIVFSYTGGIQQWIAPDDVSRLEIDARGAQGGGPAGGKGGRVVVHLPVVPGKTLRVFVGGQPIDQYAGGYNGGGSGGGWINGQSSPGGGGGASDIRRGGAELVHRILVAGAGGGQGSDGSSSSGGAGGAGGGHIGSDADGFSLVAGNGGTQSSGGAGAWVYGSALPAPAGTLGSGGAGNYLRLTAPPSHGMSPRKVPHERWNACSLNEELQGSELCILRRGRKEAMM
ncbi:MAG: glycine-rich protein [Acidimicrobiales bacterium]